MRNAYNFIWDENCRHKDHKYVKMCLQIEKIWNAQKDVEIWMISLPHFQTFFSTLQYPKENIIWIIKEKFWVQSRLEKYLRKGQRKFKNTKEHV